MQENNQTSIGTCVAFFAVGALVGAGIALLYAPQSGKETRNMLAQRTRDLGRKAGTIVDAAKQAATQKRAEFTAAVSAGREAYEAEHNRTNAG